MNFSQHMLTWSVLASSIFAATSTPVFEIENLGDQLNSKYSEFSPVISADGNLMFFIRENHPENTLFTDSTKTQDIWFSEIDPNTHKWGAAQHLLPPFNQQQFNAMCWISPSGNKLLIQDAYKEGQIVGRGFSMSHLTADGWSPPEQLDIKNYDFMSKGTFDYSAMSNNEQVMLFSFSEEKGSKNDDIYVSFLDTNNSWTQPLNLGADINTAEFTEFGPFLASDNKTLYFSSDRPGGLGGNDIWKSTRLDDSWAHWSEPVNLGAPINTTGNDSYFTIDAKGEFAYMASSNKSLGARDIVRVRLQEKEKPNPVVIIYGTVYNSKTKSPLSAELIYESLNNGKNGGSAISNPTSGKYKLVLPYGETYSFRATSPNFLSTSENIDLTQVSRYKEVEKDLYLTPIEKGANVRLNNIFFDTGKDILLPASFYELDRLYQVMIDNPNMVIEIGGHTDNVGKDDYNLKLSEKRAAAVKNYLLNKGVNVGKITSKGYGKTRSVADNNTEEGRMLNRRVEFTIISNDK